MRAKYDKFLGILMVSALLLANSAMGFAEDGLENVTLNVTEATPGEVAAADLQTDFEEETEESLPEMTNLEKQTEFLAKLKAELDMTKSTYRSTLANIADMEARLDKSDEDTLSLKGQLENLDKIAASATAKLFDVIRQVVEAENEIRLIYEQVETKEVELSYQKDLLADYMSIIYEEENKLLSFDENGEVDAVKLLLADGSVGDNLRHLEYFDLLNEAGQQLIIKLEDVSHDLKKYEKRLNRKLSNLDELQVEVESEKEQIEMQRYSKEKLLQLTNGQEEIYKELLEQTLREQEESVMDIKKLGDAILFVEQKIQEEGENFNPEEYMHLLDYKTQVLFDFRLDHDGSSSHFSWPLKPERGISAYFRDPGYAGTFGVRHNAIDLPEYQGSPIRASAHGVVYTAADNGFGYSYVILAHANGFMTVYGHISDILVSEGDTVPQGSIIGLSGGMPGTLGSGYMTTGPHLHFEMIRNGLHVDPLDYLDLDALEFDDVEWLPEKYHDKWENDTTYSPIER